MDLKTRYVVRGIGKEQTIDSVVKIHTDGDKITKVEDRWNDELPEGAFKTVSVFNPFSWLHCRMLVVLGLELRLVGTVVQVLSGVLRRFLT